MTTPTSKGYPFYAYVYNPNGMHNGAVDIQNDVALKLMFDTTIKAAVAEGREVVVADCEDICVFHAKDGRVIFPEAT